MMNAFKNTEISAVAAFFPTALRKTLCCFSKKHGIASLLQKVVEISPLSLLPLGALVGYVG